MIYYVAVAVLVLISNSNADRSEELERVVQHVDVKTGAMWWSGEVDKRFKGRNMLRHFGAMRESPEKRRMRPTIRHQVLNSELPKHFDAREQWPKCPTISEIRDQSSCGSCWAFGTTEAMSDRLCIHSNGKVQKRVGATDLLACCTYCGYGCRGGYPSAAWDFWMSDGIVTGGSFENKTGCRSYPFQHCEHHTKGKYSPCPDRIFATPECKQECDDPAKKYSDEKTKGKSSYNLYPDETTIMKELMTNGPTEVAFDVYEDFTTYKKGVYFHSWGKPLGGHAIRLVGWGEELGGIPYWLLANSWNEDWGEDGYFRILRGQNECGIESDVTAGLPAV